MDTKDDVPRTSIEALAADLYEGAAADIWYAADAHMTNEDDPDDADAKAYRKIERTQGAMTMAAALLTRIHAALRELKSAAERADALRERVALKREVDAILEALDEAVETEPEAGPAA